MHLYHGTATSYRVDPSWVFYNAYYGIVNKLRGWHESGELMDHSPKFIARLLRIATDEETREFLRERVRELYGKHATTVIRDQEGKKWR